MTAELSRIFDIVERWVSEAPDREALAGSRVATPLLDGTRATLTEVVAAGRGDEDIPFWSRSWPGRTGSSSYRSIRSTRCAE